MESSHDPDPAGYQVYLLTLWRETPNAPWRAALRPADGRPRIGFASLDALLAFLMAQTDPATPQADEQASQPSEWDHDHCRPDNAKSP